TFVKENAHGFNPSYRSVPGVSPGPKNPAEFAATAGRAGSSEELTNEFGPAILRLAAHRIGPALIGAIVHVGPVPRRSTRDASLARRIAASVGVRGGLGIEDGAGPGGDLGGGGSRARGDGAVPRSAGEDPTSRDGARSGLWLPRRARFARCLPQDL